MSSAHTTSHPVERVLRQARAMMGLSRLPGAVKRQLTAWTQGRLARGVPEEELADLVTGRSDLESADGVLLAHATGDADVLQQNVPEVRAEIDTGALDGALEAIANAEAAGSDRVGVQRAIAARRATRDLEQLLQGTLADLERALQTGDWDEHLDDLAETEIANKDRKGAARLLSARAERIDTPREIRNGDR